MWLYVTGRICRKSHYRKASFVDMIFGTHNIHRLPHILNEAIFQRKWLLKCGPKKAISLKTFQKSAKGILKHGLILCMAVISSVRTVLFHYTRGKERSRRPEDIIPEVRHLAAQGYQRNYLTWPKCECIWKRFSQISTIV